MEREREKKRVAFKEEKSKEKVIKGLYEKRDLETEIGKVKEIWELKMQK